MFVSCPQPLRNKVLRPSGARARGLKYEAQVLAMLEERFGEFLIPHPWLFSRGKYLCPDALLIRPPLLVLIEIKLSHSLGAYMQLWELYGPALKRTFKGPWKMLHLEICRWFFPEDPFPGRIHMLRELSWNSFAEAPTRATSIHIWTKQRAKRAELSDA